DGEIVAFEGAMTSYSRLQKRIQANGSGETTVPVVYYVFDLLHLDGFDATRLPLRDRKNLLKRVLRFRDPLRFTPHRNADGEQCLENACRSGWEGVVAKDAAAPYTQGRSKKWLKFKCVQRQELVI